jgi:predicted RNA-binding Zn ribbon-like protein
VHYIDVEGYPMPRLIGGHPALELCNTWSGWVRPPHSDPNREWIPDFDRFAVWSGHVGLLQPAEVRRVCRLGRRDEEWAAEVVRGAHALRLGLYRVLTAPAEGRAFRAVTRAVEEAASAARLRPAESAQDTPGWVVPASTGLRLPLLRVAQAAGGLLTSDDARRVRPCPGDDCGWLFVDRSGRRKWCSMQTCGNRAKVRAYEERRRDRTSL